ncbi:MAG: hypothetical protein QOI76_2287 [Frankiales bacterium]|nr:hypothetical protein [Frankiales bacterium]
MSLDGGHHSGVLSQEDTVTDREIQSWLMDMDGVLVREEHAIPGADRWLAQLRPRK